MTSGSDASVARYEELRSRVLAGTGGGDFGQIFLLREGLCAWLGRAATLCAASQSIADTDQQVAPLVLPNEVHAGLVRVLASMALTGRKEMTP